MLNTMRSFFFFGSDPSFNIIKPSTTIVTEVPTHGWLFTLQCCTGLYNLKNCAVSTTSQNSTIFTQNYTIFLFVKHCNAAWNLSKDLCVMPFGIQTYHFVVHALLIKRDNHLSKTYIYLNSDWKIPRYVTYLMFISYISWITMILSFVNICCIFLWPLKRA